MCILIANADRQTEALQREMGVYVFLVGMFLFAKCRLEYVAVMEETVQVITGI